MLTEIHEDPPRRGDKECSVEDGFHSVEKPSAKCNRLTIGSSSAREEGVGWENHRDRASEVSETR